MRAGLSAALLWALESPPGNVSDAPLCTCELQRADQAIADLFVSIANQLAGLGEVLTGKQKPQVQTVTISETLSNLDLEDRFISLAGGTCKSPCVQYPQRKVG